MPTYRNKHTGQVVEYDRPHPRLEASDRWESDGPEAPAGNASTDEWRTYAASVGVDVDEDAGREDIKQAIRDGV